MANPIIQRELIGLLRTWRAFGLQLALTLVLAVLVLLRWPPDAQVNLTGDQAQQVFQLFVFGLMVGLILLAPVFPATSIVRERQQGTLALLLNSPLRPWDILIGKLVGVLGYVLILLILSLPAAAACWAMGGISLGSQMFLAYGILALAAVQYSSVALFISTRAANTDTALRTTYGVVLLLSVVVLGPFEFLGRLVTGPVGELLEWTRCISPIPAMLEILGQSAGGGGVGQGLARQPHAQGHLGGGGVAHEILPLACATVRRMPVGEGPGTDDRRVSHPAGQLVEHPAGGGGRRQTAVGVPHHAAHRAVGEGAGGMVGLALARPGEPGGGIGDLRQPLGPGKARGARARQQHVGRLGHHRPGRQDRACGG